MYYCIRTFEMVFLASSFKLKNQMTTKRCVCYFLQVSHLDALVPIIWQYSCDNWQYIIWDFTDIEPHLEFQFLYTNQLLLMPQTQQPDLA